MTASEKNLNTCAQLQAVWNLMTFKPFSNLTCVVRNGDTVFENYTVRKREEKTKNTRKLQSESNGRTVK